MTTSIVSQQMKWLDGKDNGFKPWMANPIAKMYVDCIVNNVPLTKSLGGLVNGHDPFLSYEHWGKINSHYGGFWHFHPLLGGKASGIGHNFQ
jgi:hypothetical protein